MRVTVVGNKFFSAKILSQEYQDTKIDWRRSETTKLHYEKTRLPKEIKSKCLKLIKYSNLNFGAIDFALEDKEFIFLEINPNGQWAWIEKRLQYDISGAIVDLLARNEK